MNTRSDGSHAEDAAAEFVTELGWLILGRNLHYRLGEIDILADSGKEVVIIEVKAKRSITQGYAIEMLTRSKQRTLKLLARFMMKAYNKPVRIDVITIDDFASNEPKLTHYPYAVEE